MDIYNPIAFVPNFWQCDTRKMRYHQSKFANISMKSRQNSKLFYGANLGPMGYQFVKEKNRSSPATVPQKGLYAGVFLGVEGE